MPKVPGQASNVVPGPQGPQMDPTLLMMAAAGMHEQGRLFEPTPMAEPVQSFSKDPSKRVQEGHEAFEPEKSVTRQDYGTDIYNWTNKGRMRRDVVT